MYVCMYNFYLNKLFKWLILLKEIIMIIKTHIKLILNMYNLFSKFYCRDRETTCDGKFKNTIWKVWTQNMVLKITMIHQYKVELQERILIYIYISREREYPIFQERIIRNL